MAQSNRCLIHLNKLASEMNTFSEKNKYIQHLYSSSATLKMINTSSDDETQPRLWNSPLTHSSADWARSEVLLAGWTTIGTFLPASCSLISASRSSGSIWVKSCPSFDVAHAPQQKQQQQKQQQQVKILQHTRSALNQHLDMRAYTLASSLPNCSDM